MKRLKTGGRVEGTPNRVTSEIRDELRLIVLNEIDLYNKSDNNKNKRQHLENLKYILPFVCPRPTPVTDFDSSPVVIQIAGNI